MKTYLILRLFLYWSTCFMNRCIRLLQMSMPSCVLALCEKISKVLEIFPKTNVEVEPTHAFTHEIPSYKAFVSLEAKLRTRVDPPQELLGRRIGCLSFCRRFTNWPLSLRTSNVGREARGHQQENQTKTEASNSEEFQSRSLPLHRSLVEPTKKPSKT